MTNDMTAEDRQELVWDLKAICDRAPTGDVPEEVLCKAVFAIMRDLPDWDELDGLDA